MNLSNPCNFIGLGGRIRYLAAASEHQPIDGPSMILANLESLGTSLGELGFRVSSNLFQKKLQPFVLEFRHSAKQSQPQPATLTADQARRFSEAVVQFEATANAEAVECLIALPRARRIPLKHLLEQPGAVLGTGIFQKLTIIAQEDLKQACKCIAFECATAAAFHTLRCVEECTRMLYHSYFPRKPVAKQTWGALVLELHKRPHRPKPDDTLLAHLDHIRERFRNPTDHPEKCYEIEEAEDLLHIAADAINRCIRDPRVQARHAASPPI